MLMPTDFFKNNVGTEKRFCIEVEILSQFNKTGGSIIEMPIKYTGRKYSEGKKISISDGLEILIKIFQYSKFIEIFKLPRKS